MLDKREQNIEFLEYELLKLNYLLKNGRIPYIFVVSNEEYIRNYFEDVLSKNNDLIIPLDKYDLAVAYSYLEDLKKNNLLLLSIKDKEKELEASANKLNSYCKGNALYTCLVMPRELIGKTGHSLVMVCDDELITKILNGNQSVASCSHIFFVDDELENKNNLTKLKRLKY